jgi:hypothetical protein
VPAVQAPPADREAQLDAPKRPRCVGLLLSIHGDVDCRHILALLAQDLDQVPGGAAGGPCGPSSSGTVPGSPGASNVMREPLWPVASKRAAPGCQASWIDFMPVGLQVGDRG